MTRTLILGDKRWSSWSLRPWLFMRHFAVPFVEETLPFSLPDWHARARARIPSGKVPALVDHDGEIIWESLAIIEHVAAEIPNAWPVSRRGLARAVACEMHSGFPAIRRDLPFDASRTPLEIVDPAWLAADTRADLARFQQVVESCPGGPFLFGDFTAADAMLAPVATRLVSYGLPRTGRLGEWVDAIFAMPAMQEWLDGAEADRRDPARVDLHASKGARWAVIFTSQRAPGGEDYGAVAARMEELACDQRGYHGVTSARNQDGLGVTVSYWASLEDIARWRRHLEHVAAQQAGRERFYEDYTLEVCHIERTTRFP
jgi:glutathione S-transferase